MIQSGKFIVSVILIVAVLATPVLADIDGMLDNIVGGVYVQSPGIYKSASTSSMSLGSASFRLRNDLLGKPMFNISPPRATLSCSGMDFDAGLLAMLNLDQFEGMLSQAGASLAWGTMIGLVYSLPGVGEAFQKLQEWARMAQSLAGNSCAIGTALGRKLGSDIWGDQSRQAAEGQVASGAKSVYEEARKTIMDVLQAKHIYQTIPYSSLSKAGINDADIRNLLASWFGILDIYLKDNTGKRIPYTNEDAYLKNLCGGGKTCDENNVDYMPYPPQIESLMDIMNGGQFSVYTCNNINGDACAGDIGIENKNAAGLKKKIAATMKNVSGLLKDNLAGNSAEVAIINDPDNKSIFGFARLLPNFLDVLNYSALLQSSVDANTQNVSETIIDNTSELVGYMIINDFIKQARNYIDLAVSQDMIVKSKIPGAEFDKYRKRVADAEKELSTYANELRGKYELFRHSFNNYKALREQGARSIVSNFGMGAYMFGR